MFTHWLYCRHGHYELISTRCARLMEGGHLIRAWPVFLGNDVAHTQMREKFGQRDINTSAVHTNISTYCERLSVAFTLDLISHLKDSCKNQRPLLLFIILKSVLRQHNKLNVTAGVWDAVLELPLLSTTPTKSVPRPLHFCVGSTNKDVFLIYAQIW